MVPGFRLLVSLHAASSAAVLMSGAELEIVLLKLEFKNSAQLLLAALRCVSRE